VQPGAQPRAETLVDEPQVAQEPLVEQPLGAAAPVLLQCELRRLRERGRSAPESPQSSAARLEPEAQTDAE
jgi:hypothetical protein